jgi:hypothetical protein
MLCPSVFSFAAAGQSNSYPDKFKLNPYISANGYVRVVLIHDTILYVGGEFTEVTDELGSYERNGIAAYNLSTGRVTGFKADINRGYVRAIAIGDNKLYIGGSFTRINAIRRSKVAAVDPVSGAVVATFSSGNSEINGPVFALACIDAKVFVGGDFTQVNGNERSYLAALDATTGILDPSFDPSPRDSMDIDGKMLGGVWALEAHPDNKNHPGKPGILFVAGNFQTVTGIEGSPFLVALTTDGAPGPAFAVSSISPICDIDCKGNALYTGVGGFGNRVVAYDIGSAADSYTELWKGITAQGDAQAVTCSDSGFVFFSFHQGLFDTTDFHRWAVLEAKSGCLYDTMPPMTSFLGIWALDVENDYLVAGGTFNDIGDNLHDYLAVFKNPPYPQHEIPGQVSLADPPDGSIGVSRNQKFTWNFVAYADMYELQAATDTLFQNCVVAEPMINTLSKRSSGLDKCTRYFWRVRARNEWGIGAWSAVGQFITAPGEDDIPVIIEPVDEAQLQPVEFACRWHPTTSALSYTFQVSSEYDFFTTLMSHGGSIDTSAVITGLGCNSRYYLRVKAMTIGGWTDWAIVNFATVPAAPPAPSGLAPDNSATQVACSPGLVWTAVADSANVTDSANAVSYGVQLSVDSNFVDVIVDTAKISDTTITLAGLGKETVYYWRVHAANAGGKTWSTPMQFTTAFQVPSCPVALLPPAGDVVSTDSVRIVWRGSTPHVTNYRIEIAHDSLVAAPFVTVMTTDTTYALSGLDDKADVYWRVKAYNETGGGAYSTTAVFMTSFPTHPVYRNSVDRFDFRRGIGYVNYSIAQQNDVALDLFDLRGNLAWQSIRRNATPGYYSDRIPHHLLSPGRYILSIKAGGFTKKIGAMLVE